MEEYYDPNLEKSLQQSFHRDYLKEKLVIACYNLVEYAKDDIPDILIDNQLRLIKKRIQCLKKVYRLEKNHDR